MKNLITLFFTLIALISCSAGNQNSESENINLTKAKQTLDSLYKYYSIEGSHLLRETYPFDDNYKASYLASDEKAERPNPYSYLWPYSGTFSAVNILYEATKDSVYSNKLESDVLTGLEEYFDKERTPYAYASYINNAPESDRFYDDNIWLGIDFTDIYIQTGNDKYLDKAKLIWKFVESGMDDKLGGGIYWCEQKKMSKNTCSNAPGAVYALKLFAATKDSSYFYQGKFLYEWTKANLQDSTDYLYYDNIKLDGKIGKAKYAYNSGQMMQSAVLLYKATDDNLYLTEAQNIAKSCFNHFFVDFESDGGGKFRMLKKGDTWFIAVMFRGFSELYLADKDKTYVDAFQKNLDYAWTRSRSANGLFERDWSGATKDSSKWVLTQAAMVEMYARMAEVNN